MMLSSRVEEPHHPAWRPRTDEPRRGRLASVQPALAPCYQPLEMKQRTYIHHQCYKARTTWASGRCISTCSRYKLPTASAFTPDPSTCCNVSQRQLPLEVHSCHMRGICWSYIKQVHELLCGSAVIVVILLCYSGYAKLQEKVYTRKKMDTPSPPPCPCPTAPTELTTSPLRSLKRMPQIPPSFGNSQRYSNVDVGAVA
jgi:hypothetical protein